jgi:hypothetical protein
MAWQSRGVYHDISPSSSLTIISRRGSSGMYQERDLKEQIGLEHGCIRDRQ